MIYHIVSFYLVEKNELAVQQLKDDLMPLRELSEVDSFQLSEQVQKGGDVVLFATFHSEQLLQAYMEDAGHQQIIKKTAPLIRQKEVVDFELP